MSNGIYDGGEIKFFGVRRMTDDLCRITLPREMMKMFSMRAKTNIGFRSVHIAGLGQGVFVYPTDHKTEAGRQIDYTGRFIVPFRMARALNIGAKTTVEMIPMKLDDCGSGVFIHKVPTLQAEEIAREDTDNE